MKGNFLCKGISIVVSVIILCFTFTSCGGKKPPESKTESESVSGQQTNSTVSSVTATTGATESTDAGGGIIRTGNSAASTSKKAATTTKRNQQDFDPYAKIPSNLKGTTVRMLTWVALTDYDKKVISDFTAKTGIKVVPTVTTYGLYPTRLAAAVTSGASPDMMGMHARWWPSFITKNLVQPITVGDFDLEKDIAYDKTIMDMAKWGGKYYGIAIRGSNQCTLNRMVFYNKNMFLRAKLKTPTQLWAEGKWNWDTYLEAAKTLTKEENGKQIYGMGVSNFDAVMLSADTDYVKFKTTGDSTKIINNLSDQKLVKAFQYYINADSVYKVRGGNLEAFINGTVATFAGEDDLLLKGSLLSKMTDPWGVVPFPSPAGQKHINPSATNLWGIAVGAKNPKAASYFMRYFLDPDNQSPDRFVNDECRLRYYEMQDLKKNTLRSLGIVGFNSDSDYWDLQTKVIYGTVAQISTNLAAWSPKLDGIIKDLENEIPKK